MPSSTRSGTRASGSTARTRPLSQPFAHALPIDHLVELDGVRSAINVRPIHPDEIDEVACP